MNARKVGTGYDIFSGSAGFAAREALPARGRRGGDEEDAATEERGNSVPQHFEYKLAGYCPARDEW